ncbi:class I SAM-dependent RNA methyltransferase [Paracoccus sp. MC1862]|uniref:class I SAM-dependent RNA methyltransferase n=1 Tax=Paracoccus sp. MC1862 TaxID=2760307 RepID=UPI001601D9EA|nr:class I SAM-dependent RNA methyltransferase [Paracoccus sp. MC1862]MBB1498738.1 class I SAM-dependent RNA methyltransferase [Paracoccus sp. MC1862]QQO43901.1 class I SAM-dependent RNA methyltransferase [Paracoccus sp. MC1862]
MTHWTVERLGRRGDGVALRGDERALAPLTLPGEQIEGEAKAGRIARPRIVTPSADRVKAPCPHYKVCGGCSLMHASDGFVAGWKAQVVRNALAAQGITAEIAEVHTSPPRSRRRAVLSGRRTKAGALIGFHQRASDVIVDVAECLVVRPAILAALPDLRRLVSLGGSRTRELSLVVTESAAGLDVAVAGGKPMTPGLLSDLAALMNAAAWARLDWDGEAIVARPPAISFGRAQVVPPPGGFLQATAEGEAALLTAARRIVGPAPRIADLFAGAGTFTLPLAETAEVHAVEGLAAPLAALDAGWRAAPGLRRVTTEVRDLARRPLLPDELARFDAAVIDPPRAGAAAQAAALAQSQVPAVAWISCDPVSFARDARTMVEGGYSLGRIEVVDQFRWSPHVELIATFTQ